MTLQNCSELRWDSQSLDMCWPKKQCPLGQGGFLETNTITSLKRSLPIRCNHQSLALRNDCLSSAKEESLLCKEDGQEWNPWLLESGNHIVSPGDTCCSRRLDREQGVSSPDPNCYVLYCAEGTLSLYLGIPSKPSLGRARERAG